MSDAIRQTLAEEVLGLQDEIERLNKEAENYRRLVVWGSVLYGALDEMAYSGCCIDKALARIAIDDAAKEAFGEVGAHD